MWHRCDSRHGSDMCTEIGKEIMTEAQSDKNPQWFDDMVRQGTQWNNNLGCEVESHWRNKGPKGVMSTINPPRRKWILGMDSCWPDGLIAR